MKYFNLPGGAANSYIRVQSITFDEIILDFTARQVNGRYYLDSRTGIANAYFLRNSSGTDLTSASSPFASGIYLNGTNISYNTVGIIPSNQRMTLRFVLAISGTDDVNIFSQNDNANGMAVDVFSIKFLLGGVTKAFFDMSTGTLIDQSGNGVTLTSTGGTWLDDGTGGSTGTDGSATFDLKQSIYSDSSLNADTKLSLYSDSLTTLDTKQSLYQDSSLAVDSRQMLYSDSATSYDSKQILFNDSLTVFDTLQDLIDNTLGSTTFDMRVTLYSESVTLFDTRQAWYTEGGFQADLQQMFVEPSQPIVGVITLQVHPQTNIYLKGSQPSAVHIKSNAQSTIHLKGGIQ